MVLANFCVILSYAYIQLFFFLYYCVVIIFYKSCKGTVTSDVEGE